MVYVQHNIMLYSNNDFGATKYGTGTNIGTLVPVSDLGHMSLYILYIRIWMIYVQ